MDAIAEVRRRERALHAAMLTGDVAALDALIDDELVFVTPDGSLVSKAQDLASHASGTLRLDRLDSQEEVCRLLGAAVHTVTGATLAGSFDGTPFAGRFVYSRLWWERDGTWRVVAGHAGAVTAA